MSGPYAVMRSCRICTCLFFTDATPPATTCFGCSVSESLSRLSRRVRGNWVAWRAKRIADRWSHAE